MPDHLEVHAMTQQKPRDPDELAPGTDPPGDTDSLTAGEGLGSLNNDADQDPLTRGKKDGPDMDAAARGQPGTERSSSGSRGPRGCSWSRPCRRRS
jgi:hypothetical protein